MIRRYCPSCKKSRWIVNKYQKSKICKKCLCESMRGLDWRLSSCGYVIKQIPFKKNGKIKRYQINQHRHVMEKHLGRKLRKDEHVHHINHIKTDNRIENLELMTMSEHIRHHSRSVEGRKRRRLTALNMHKKLGHKISQTN